MSDSGEEYEAGGPDYCAHTSYDRGEPRESYPRTGEDATGVTGRVWEALRAVEDGHATVRFTLTYTGCPARDYLLSDVERATGRVEGVESVEVELVWSPPWTVDMVTDAGRESLREFGVSV